MPHVLLSNRTRFARGLTPQSASGMTGGTPLLRFHDQAVDLEPLELAAGLGGGRSVEAGIARAKERFLPLLDRQCHGRAAWPGDRPRARAPLPAGARPRPRSGRRRSGSGRHRAAQARAVRAAAGCLVGPRGCGEATPRSSPVRQPAARHAPAWRPACSKVEGDAPRTTVISENGAGLSDGAAGGVAGARFAAVVHCGASAETRLPAPLTVDRAAPEPVGRQGRPGAARPGPNARARSRRSVRRIVRRAAASLPGSAGGVAAGVAVRQRPACSAGARERAWASAPPRSCGAAAGRGAWAISGAGGWRVFSLEAFTRPILRNVRMAALREEALAPPKTAPITCFLPRRTDATRLNPEARV